MRKFLKILSVIVLLVGIVLAIATWKADSIAAKFKPQIEGLLSRLVKEPVTFSNLSLEFFPVLAIEVVDVTIQPKGKTVESAARVGRLLLETGIGSLLSGNLTVSSIVLDDVRLDIHRNADKSIDVSGIQLERKTPDNSQPATGAAESPGRLTLRIDSLQIHNSTITYIDRTQNPPLNVALTNVDGEISEIDFRGSAVIDISFSAFEGEKTKFSAQGKVGNPVSGLETDLKVRINELDLGAARQTAQAFVALPSELKLGSTTALDLNVKTMANAFDIRGTIDGTKAEIVYGDKFQKPSGTELTLQVEGTASLAGALEVKRFELQLGENKLRAPLSLNNGQFQCELEAEGLSLTTLAPYFPLAQRYAPGGMLTTKLRLSKSISGKSAPLAISGPLTFGNVNLKKEHLSLTGISGTIHFEDGGVATKDLTLAIQGQPLSLSGKVSSFDQPVMALVASAEQLDLEKLASASSGSPPSALAGGRLSGVNVKGSYTAASERGSVTLDATGGSLGGTDLSGISLVTEIDPRLVQLEPSTLSLFGGKVTVSGRLERGESGALSTVLQGEGLDAAQVSRTFLKGGKISLTGTISSLKANLQTVLAKPADALSGTGVIVVERGEIVGVNIVQETLGKITSIPGIGLGLASYIPERARPLMSGEGTQFDRLSGSITLGGRAVQLREIALQHTLYLITGQGTIGFDGTLDLKAQLRLTPQMAGDMTLKEPKLKLLFDPLGNLTIPVSIFTKGDATIVLPDTEHLVQNAARNTAKEAAGRALDKIAPGLGEATKALDSLFK